MTVYHPRALESTPAGPPGGVTVGGSTYSVGADGAVECPDDLEADVAATLADCYGIDAEALLDDGDDQAESDGGVVPDSGGCAEPTHTRDELEELTKEDVLEIAQDVDLEGRSSMNKDELIGALAED